MAEKRSLTRPSKQGRGTCPPEIEAPSLFQAPLCCVTVQKLNHACMLRSGYHEGICCTWDRQSLFHQHYFPSRSDVFNSVDSLSPCCLTILPSQEHCKAAHALQPISPGSDVQCDSLQTVISKDKQLQTDRAPMNGSHI